jgi:hypothetical protein
VLGLKKFKGSAPGLYSFRLIFFKLILFFCEFFSFIFLFILFFCLFDLEKKQSSNKECFEGEEMKPLTELKKGLSFFLFVLKDDEKSVKRENGLDLSTIFDKRFFLLCQYPPMALKMSLDVGRGSTA